MSFLLTSSFYSCRKVIFESRSSYNGLIQNVDIVTFHCGAYVNFLFYKYKIFSNFHSSPSKSESVTWNFRHTECDEIVLK